LHERGCPETAKEDEELREEEEEASDWEQADVEEGA
jgi:hypothetical protein